MLEEFSMKDFLKQEARFAVASLLLNLAFTSAVFILKRLKHGR